MLALKKGFDIIATGANDCGLPDTVAITATLYDGYSTRRPDIDQTGCNSTPDRYNEVGYADLQNGIMGIACMRRTSAIGDNPITEGDIAYNSVDYNFVTTITSSCRHSVHLPSVAAHEAGHIFGLAHVSESTHPRMTMSGGLSRCDFGPSTLGWGDWLGLDQRDAD